MEGPRDEWVEKIGNGSARATVLDRSLFREIHAAARPDHYRLRRSFGDFRRHLLHEAWRARRVSEPAIRRHDEKGLEAVQNTAID